MKGFLLGVLLFTSPLAAAPIPGSFVVVVNAENPLPSATRSTVSGLFLKHIGKWPSGVKSRPVDLAETSSTRESFSRQIHGRGVFEIEKYWQTTIFSGREIPPPKKVSDVEVLDFVVRYSGAIGYVSPETPLPPGVKVLRVQ